MNRIVRDVLILIAFCGSFYMLTRFAGSQENSIGGRSNFSAARLRADESARDGNWESAITNYDKLLEEDPTNTLAMYRRGAVNLNRVTRIVRDLGKRRRTAKKEQDDDLVDQIESEISMLTDDAIAHEKKLLQSPRYRTAATRHLMVLYCFAGDKTSALDLLEECFSDDMLVKQANQNLLLLDPRLEILRDEPRFQNLCRRHLDSSRARWYGEP